MTILAPKRGQTTIKSRSDSYTIRDLIIEFDVPELENPREYLSKLQNTSPGFTYRMSNERKKIYSPKFNDYTLLQFVELVNERGRFSLGNLEGEILYVLFDNTDPSLRLTYEQWEESGRPCALKKTTIVQPF